MAAVEELTNTRLPRLKRTDCEMEVVEEITVRL